MSDTSAAVVLGFYAQHIVGPGSRAGLASCPVCSPLYSAQTHLQHCQPYMHLRDSLWWLCHNTCIGALRREVKVPRPPVRKPHAGPELTQRVMAAAHHEVMMQRPCRPSGRMCSNPQCKNPYDSPQWRRGPLGPGTLCNACGTRYARLQAKMNGDKKVGPPSSHLSAQCYSVVCTQAAGGKVSNPVDCAGWLQKVSPGLKRIAHG